MTMRKIWILPVIVTAAVISQNDPACAHLSTDPNAPQAGKDSSPIQYDLSILPPTNIVFLADNAPFTQASRAAFLTAAFQPFSPKVQTHWDDLYFYVASDGIPDHRLMVGITAWQQQLPLPQNYIGNNSWRFPMRPEVSAHPQTIRGHFLRGAIAIAVNGVPIFNPQNNRGEVSAEIGELDEFGGHAGRADDYHYHAAPLHLQKYVGTNNPIAFALDGYPIYGLTEPDGSVVTGLDECNGHSTSTWGYHYHASTHYPYVNGGFHGVVNEVGGQVDPQPRAQPVRPATVPLRGARITDFKYDADGKSYTLTYTLAGEPMKIHYSRTGGTARFDFTDSTGVTTTKTYSTGMQRPPREGSRGDDPNRPQRPQRPPGESAQ